MRDLSTPLHVARHVLYNDKAWLWFFELPLRGGGVARVVRNIRNVTANGKMWQAAAIEVEIPPETQDGALSSITVRVPNVSRVIAGWADSGAHPTVSGEEGPGEILGQLARVYLQHESSLDEFDASMVFEAEVLEAGISVDVAELTLGDPAQTVRLPAGVWDRTIAPQLLPSGQLSTL